MRWVQRVIKEILEQLVYKAHKERRAIPELQVQPEQLDHRAPRERRETKVIQAAQDHRGHKVLRER